MEGGLEADLGLLHGQHGFFEADVGVAQLHLGLQAGGFVLGGADGFQCGLEAIANARVCGCTRTLQGVGTHAGEGLTGQGADAHVHGGVLQLQLITPQC